MRRLVLVIGVCAALAAAGCGAGGDGAADARAPDAASWDCWGEPVSSEWAADTTWQTITHAGDFGGRTERIRTRGPDHPYSVDLETVDASGPAGSTQRRAQMLCDDERYYDSSWLDSTELANPGCPYPAMLVMARAQVRSASCN